MKSKAIRIILVLLLVIGCGQYLYFTVASHYWRKAVAEVREKHRTEQEIGKKNRNRRPLPDIIDFKPERVMTLQDGHHKFGYDNKGKKQKEQNALKIIKKDGVYYWESFEGKPLMLRTKITKLLPNSTPRKTSMFTALDSSGMILIFHDDYWLKGACHAPASPNAYYIEYRFTDTFKKFEGTKKYFPERPQGWCDTLETQYIKFKKEYSLIEEIKKNFGL